MKTIAIVLLTLTLLPHSQAFADFKAGRPSWCGTLGCPELFVEVLPYALLDPELRLLKLNAKILSVTSKRNGVTEMFDIRTEFKGSFCVRAEYLEMPARINGKATVNVEGRHVLFTTYDHRCP